MNDVDVSVRADRPGDIRGRTLAALTMCILIVTGLSVQWWTTAQRESEAKRLARMWSAAKVHSLAESVSDTLLRAERVLRTLRLSAQLTSPHPSPLEPAVGMAAFLRSYESFEFVYAGLADGSSYGVQRLLSGRIEVFTRAPGAPARLWELTDAAEAVPLDEVDPIPFDPTQTAWYGMARSSPKIVWSRPYTGIGAASVVTASLAADDGTPGLVFGVDVSLAGIARKNASDPAPTLQSSVFILNREAAPISGLERSADRGHEPALDLFLHSGAGRIDQLTANEPLVSEFVHDGEAFVGAICPVELSVETVGAVVLLTPGEDVSAFNELGSLQFLSTGFIATGLVLGIACIVALRGGAPVFGVGPMDLRGEPSERRDSESRSGQFPQRLVACLRLFDLDMPETLHTVRESAQGSSFEIVGEMPDRILLSAQGEKSCEELVEFGVRLAKPEGFAVGFAPHEQSLGTSAALAERLASTPGRVNVPEQLADPLGRRYAVTHRAPFWLEGIGEVSVYLLGGDEG